MLGLSAFSKQILKWIEFWVDTCQTTDIHGVEPFLSLLVGLLIAEGDILPRWSLLMRNFDAIRFTHDLWALARPFQGSKRLYYQPGYHEFT